MENLRSGSDPLYRFVKVFMSESVVTDSVKQFPPALNFWMAVIKSAPVVPGFSRCRLVVAKLLYGRLISASWMYSFITSIFAALILLRRC
jgi:uncharacterized membrane protein